MKYLYIYDKFYLINGLSYVELVTDSKYQKKFDSRSNISKVMTNLRKPSLFNTLTRKENLFFKVMAIYW